MAILAELQYSGSRSGGYMRQGQPLPYKVTISELKGGSLPLRNAYFSARLFQTPRVVLLTRTSEPFQSVAEIEGCTEELARRLPASGRPGWRVVIDMRLGPTRVEPTFDPAFERLRKETHAGFARVAVVVSTPLGRVRAERLSKISNVPVAVVGSLEDALQFINTP